MLQPSHKSGSRKGYTKAVDFWALGVSTYTMMTGEKPHTVERLQMYEEKTARPKQSADELPELAMLRVPVEYPSVRFCYYCFLRRAFPRVVQILMSAAARLTRSSCRRAQSRLSKAS